MENQKFRGKYRIESLRLRNWDYGNNGYYFITICTKKRVQYFGEIIHGQIELSPIGKIAEKYWLEIPFHFAWIKLFEFVIMPDHVHGIICINKNPNLNQSKVDSPDSGESTPANTQIDIDKKWKPGILGVIINQYKRACTIKSRKINPEFSWQSGYYDRIIRTKNEFLRIQNYIIGNPKSWGK